MLRPALIPCALGILVLACGGEPAAPQVDPITLQFDVTDVSAFGESDGAIDLTVTGGLAPFDYTWTHGATSEDLTGLSVGIYWITVSDAAAQAATGSVVVQQPPQDTGSVTDADGNLYRTVRIGDQWWMAENLRVSVDPDGNPIGSSDNGIYGRSYTWEVLMNGSTEPKAQGIAPDGWHIPDQEDWNLLFAALGGIDVAGGKLKAVGTEHWRSPNTGATNASGFSALPDPFGEGAWGYTHFHTSSGLGTHVVLPSLKFNGGDAYVIEWLDNDNFLSTVQHAVRCVKN